MCKELSVVTTERLILRGITEEDSRDIVLWRANPEVYQYFKSPKALTIQDHLDWLHNIYAASDNRFDWMCLEQQTGRHVGVFGLVRKEGEAEVNYLLAPSAQHRGYGYEAVKRLILFANRTWNTKRFIAEIHSQNLASLKLIEKLGFVEEARNGNFILYGYEVIDDSYQSGCK